MKTLWLVTSAICLAGCSAQTEAPEVAQAPQPTAAPVPTATIVAVVQAPIPPPQMSPPTVVQPPQANQGVAAGSQTYTGSGLVNLLGDGIKAADSVDKVLQVRDVSVRLGARFLSESRAMHGGGQHSEASLGPGLMVSAMNHIYEAAEQKRRALTDDRGLQVALMQGVEPEIMKAKIEAEQADRAGYSVTLSPNDR